MSISDVYSRGHSPISKWKTKLAWLAGIIDGEGYILVNENHGSGRHICRINFTNTDEGILSAGKAILMEMGVFFTSQMQPASHNGKKDCWRIEVNRQLEVHRLAKLILPYIRSASKRQKLERAMQLIEEKPLMVDGRRRNLRRQFRGHRLVISGVH